MKYFHHGASSFLLVHESDNGGYGSRLDCMDGRYAARMFDDMWKKNCHGAPNYLVRFFGFM